MNIIPIGSKIYFEPENAKSLLVTDSKKKEKGKVLAVGPKVTEVKVGDIIIFTPWAVDTYEENLEKYYFTEENELLLAKVEMS